MLTTLFKYFFCPIYPAETTAVESEYRSKVSFRLYIPGPVEVSEETLKAMGTPMIGHRSPEFVELYQSIQPDLQKLLYTEDPVFISTSSAWGVMEGALRNLVAKKVLCCMNGAFSDKWLDVAKRLAAAPRGGPAAERFQSRGARAGR